MANIEKYCPNCGTVAVPKRYMRGGFVTELLLWLFFILPGIIYSVYRLASKYEVCPQCGARNMIPLDSPVARAARSGTPIAEPVGAPMIDPDDGGRGFSRAAAAVAMAVVIMAVIVWIVVNSGALQ